MLTSLPSKSPDLKVFALLLPPTEDAFLYFCPCMCVYLFVALEKYLMNAQELFTGQTSATGRLLKSATFRMAPTADQL